MNDQTVFNLPGSFDLPQIQDALSGKFKYHLVHKKKQTITFYDTFDWRIYNAGMVLFSISRRFYLRQLNSETIVAEVGFQKRPVFIRDFAHNILKERLNPIIGLRALTVKCTATFFEDSVNILNSDEKTVCRLLIREVIPKKSLDSTSEYHTINLIPLRGYAKDARLIVKGIKSLSVSDDPARDSFDFIVEAYGIQPGEYQSKINIKLKRNMPAHEAIKSILKFLLQVMQQNEEGSKKDIDTEFLHDFRVAVRRTRAALSLISIVFPPNILQQNKKDFSFIGKLSNQLRDLDVYLLNEETYKKMIPLKMQKDISILFGQLRKERQVAFRQFVNALNSQQYKKITKSWQIFLESDNTESDNHTETNLPIIDVVKPIIHNQLAIVLNLGSEINETTEDKKVHELRLECKKLRYLLEFFSSLFPKQKVEKFISHLKILQDNLGDFNDYSIQQGFLNKNLKEMPLTGAKSKKSIAVIGALIGVLYDKQLKTRQEFSVRYAQFASTKNITLAMKLFRD